MSLPISREVLRSEVESAKNILEGWLEKVDAGIPGVDVPAADLDTEVWVHQLCGELLVVAGKLETVSGVITGDRV